MMMLTENLGHALLILGTLLIMAILVIMAVAYAIKVGIQLYNEVDSGALDFVYDDDDEDVSVFKKSKTNEKSVTLTTDRTPLNKENKKRFNQFIKNN